MRKRSGADSVCELRVGSSKKFGWAWTSEALSDGGVIGAAMRDCARLHDDDDISLGKELHLGR